MPGPQHHLVTCEVHDKVRHKGIYSMLHALLDHFWWPSLADDVKLYIKSCHNCQIHQMTKVRIPPAIATPATLFCKVYFNTMFMPLAGSFWYIIQAWCSLTAWPEWCALHTEKNWMYPQCISLQRDSVLMGSCRGDCIQQWNSLRCSS